MIVDASGLIGAWTAGKLDRIPESKTTTLIFYELGNVFWKMHKREGSVWSPENYGDLVEYLRASFDLFEPDFVEVLFFSRRTGLSFYDASYLWLAVKFDEPILTLDTDFVGKWETVSPEEL